MYKSYLEMYILLAHLLLYFCKNIIPFFKAYSIKYLFFNIVKQNTLFPIMIFKNNFN